MQKHRNSHARHCEFLEPRVLLASQAYNFQTVPIGGGGVIQAIFFSPTVPNLIYARTDVGGAYRWDQSLGRWTALTDYVPVTDPVGGQGVESMALDPNDSNRVYAAMGANTSQGKSFILRSSDRGQTWQRSDLPFGMGSNENADLSGSGGERLMVDPNSSNILFLCTRQHGLWKSTDYGINWNQVPSFPVTTTPNGVGLEFVKFLASSGTKGSPTPTIYVAVSQTVNNFYRSTDGGTTWQNVSNPALDPTQVPERASLDSDGSMYVTFTLPPIDLGSTFDGSLWKLNTGTGVWTNVTPNTTVHGTLTGVSVDPEHQGWVVVATTDRWWPRDDVYRSTNGGATWTSLRGSDQPASQPDTSIWDPGVLSNGGGVDIEIDPFNSNHVLLPGPGGSLAVGSAGGIAESFDLTSADSGLPTHWKSDVNGIEQTAQLAFISPPSGAPLITAAGDVGGTRFTDPSTFGTGYSLMDWTNRDIDFAESNPNLMVRCGDTSPYIVYSRDNGVTWTAFPSLPANTGTGTAAMDNAGRLAMSADGNTVVWDPGDDATNNLKFPLSYSTWNGSTWSSWTTSTFSGSADMQPVSDRVNPNDFYILDNQNLYASTDGGATWTLKNSSAPYGKLRASFAAEGDLWIAEGNGNGGLFHSTDHGATWTQVASSTVLLASDVAFGKSAPGQSYPAIYTEGIATGTTGIFRSDDGGTTWVSLSDAQNQVTGYLAADRNVYGRFYVGGGPIARGIIMGEIQSTAPSVATAATISANPVTGTTASLSVLGADDGGESNLTYTWRVTNKPPASTAPTFSVNGTNAAKNTTVTFVQAGYYSFQVTMKDAQGHFIASSVGVTVNPTQFAASIVVTPSPVTVTTGATRQLTATAYDQFGQVLTTQPTFTWSVLSGAGSISSAGLYTAPGTAGTATIRAISGRISATTTLTISTQSTELAWYQADATGGSTLADSSGHGQTATLSGAYAFASGVSGNALSLSGGYATLPTGIVSSLNDFTISTWVKLNSLDYWSRIFDFGTGTAVNMFLTPQAGGTGLPRFAITTNNSWNEQQVNSSTAIAVGVWTHVAVTLSGNTCTLYLNGVAVGSNTGMTVHPAAMGSTTQNYLGKSQYVADAALQGSIDDFRLFGRALSASEVLALSTPTLASPAVASPGTVNGTATNLTALGADATGGEAGLRYIWAMTSGPAVVSFAANGTNAAKHTEADFTQPGTYTFQVTITNGGGRSVASSVTVPVSFGIFNTAGVDIGSPSPAGAGGYNLSNDTYSVTGGGADINGTSDQFRFLSENVTGDATVIARISGLDHTNAAARAGVMIRNSTAANAMFASVMVMYDWSIAFMWRSSTGGGTTFYSDWAFAPPIWLKLVRSGNSFSAFYATTSGTPAASDWTQFAPTQTIAMNSSAQGGLAVTSHVNGTPNTGTFSGVQITQAAPTVAIVASATPNPVNAASTALFVLGADNGGESNLTYTWTTTGTPPAPVTFTANGTNAAKSTTASFTATGTYHFQVTITNASGQSTTSATTVTVNPPAWLGSGSAAAWNPSAKMLTVSGVASIVADPAGDSPIIQAATSADQIMVSSSTASQIHVGSINLTNGASLFISDTSTPQVLVVASGAGNFSIDSTSKFNLGKNYLDLQNSAGNIAAVDTLLQRGFGNGTWNGTGLTSSDANTDSTHRTGLGSIINGNQFNSSSKFDGVTPGPNDAPIRYTYTGDADLSGSVTGNDYTLIDAGFGSATLKGWQNGDFNYDNHIDGSDYSLIDNVFNQQATPLAEIAASVVASKSATPATRLTAETTKAMLASPATAFAVNNVAASTIDEDWFFHQLNRKHSPHLA